MQAALQDTCGLAACSSVASPNSACYLAAAARQGRAGQGCEQTGALQLLPAGIMSSTRLQGSPARATAAACVQVVPFSRASNRSNCMAPAGGRAALLVALRARGGVPAQLAPGTAQRRIPATRRRPWQATLPTNPAAGVAPMTSRRFSKVPPPQAGPQPSHRARVELGPGTAPGCQGLSIFQPRSPASGQRPAVLAANALRSAILAAALWQAPFWQPLGPADADLP